MTWRVRWAAAASVATAAVFGGALVSAGASAPPPKAAAGQAAARPAPEYGIPVPLDAEMRDVLDELDRLDPRPLPSLPPAVAREEPGAKTASKELRKKRNGGRLPPPRLMAKVEDRTYPAPAGPRAIRVYTPLVGGKAPGGPLPVLVFAHGGGWTIGSIAGYDESARSLADAARCVVVSVSYRYAPEHPFPAAHEDVYAALRYVQKNAAALGGDPARVALGGESAGGNISAGVALLARDRGTELPVHLLLIYPPTDTRTDTPSYRRFARAVPLDRAQMVWFLDNVIGKPADRDSPYLAPLRAPSLRGLPPTTVITAEIDPLQDDGEWFAARLRRSGVLVRYRDFQGVTHEFFSMSRGLVPDADAAVAFAAEGLRASFGPVDSAKTAGL